MPVEYKDGQPLVADRYNAATEFTIKVTLPDDVEMIITSQGDDGILFEGDAQANTFLARESRKGYETKA